jgi:RHS repeat-associated protein
VYKTNLSGSVYLAYYRHADRLGSSRATSPATQGGSPTRTGMSYAPYGETFAGAGDQSFTGQSQDTAQGLYDFLYRRESQVQGRWLSPDPSGLGAASLGGPQSWNRYAYVGNGPLAATDPDGLNWGGGCGSGPTGGSCGERIVHMLLVSEFFSGWDEFEALQDAYSNPVWLLGFAGTEDMTPVATLYYPYLSLLNYINYTDLDVAYSWLSQRTAPNTQYVLKRTTDCFGPADNARTSNYTLAGPGVTDDASIEITEHQTNDYLTHGNLGMTSDYGDTFHDLIGGPDPNHPQESSVRYFTVLMGTQDLGLVPVQYGGQTYAYEGIWTNIDLQNPSKSQVLVNGQPAEDSRASGSCDPGLNFQ